MFINANNSGEFNGNRFSYFNGYVLPSKVDSFPWSNNRTGPNRLDNGNWNRRNLLFFFRCCYRAFRFKLPTVSICNFGLTCTRVHVQFSDVTLFNTPELITGNLTRDQWYRYRIYRFKNKMRHLVNRNFNERWHFIPRRWISIFQSFIGKSRSSYRNLYFHRKEFETFDLTSNYIKYWKSEIFSRFSKS